MEIFKKSDLSYEYSWPDFKTEGQAFDPANGIQVLHLINQFLNTYNLKSVASGKRTENILKKRLPSMPTDSSQILNFLEQHY